MKHSKRESSVKGGRDRHPASLPPSSSSASGASPHPRPLLAGMVVAMVLLTTWGVHPGFTDFFAPKFLILSVMGAALLLHGAVKGFSGQGPVREDLDGFTLLALGGLAWSALSLFWAKAPGVGVMQVASMASLMVLFFAARRAFPLSPRSQPLVWVVVAATVAGGIAALQLLGFHPLSATSASVAEEASQAGLYAAASTIGHKNLMAGALAIALPPLLALATGRRRLPLWGLAGGFAVLILALQSRGAWLGLLGAVAVVVAVRVKARWGGRVPGLALLAAASLFVVAVGVSAGIRTFAPGSPLAERIGALTDWDSQKSLSGRAEIWATSLYMVGKAPVFGVGAGNFSPRFLGMELERRKASGVREGGGVVSHHAHSDPLEILAESGPLGLLLFGGLWVGALVWAWRRPHPDPDENRLLQGASLGLLVMGVHSLVDFPFHSPANAALGTLLLAAVVPSPPSTPHVALQHVLSSRLFGVACGVTALVLAVSGIRWGDANLKAREGVALFHQGNPSEARRLLEQSRERGGNQGTALYYLGNIAREAGNLPSAIRLYQESLRWNDHHVARRDLGLAQAAHGDRDASIANLEDYLWIHPASSPRPFLVLGAQYIQKGDRAAAIDTFLRCYCSDGSFYAGQMLEEEKKLDEAAQRYREANSDRGWKAVALLEARRDARDAAWAAVATIRDEALRNEVKASVGALIPPPQAPK